MMVLVMVKAVCVENKGCSLKPVQLVHVVIFVVD